MGNAPTCQACGAPVTSREPEELQLRVAQLVDEDALPTWLRNMSEEGESGALESYPHSPFAPHATASSPQPSFAASTSGERLPEWLRMIQASDTSNPGSSSQSPSTPVVPNALIEEDALPEWLRASASLASAVSEALSSSLPGIKEAPASPGEREHGMSADTLIDTSALPAWMRQSATAPDPRANPIFGELPVSPLPSASTTPTHQPAPMNSAEAEDEELPEWLRRVYEEANVPAWTPPAEPSKPTPAPAPAAPSEPSRIAASSLIEPTSLPEWLQQEPAPPAAAAPDVPIMEGPPPGGRLSAASLIEQSSLPEWLRAADGSQSASPPTVPPSAPTTRPARLAAGDLIDPAALPSWLQTAAAPAAGGYAASITPSASAPSSTEEVPGWFRQLSSSSAPPAEPTTARATAVNNAPASSASAYPAASELDPAAPARAMKTAADKPPQASTEQASPLWTQSMPTPPATVSLTPAAPVSPPPSTTPPTLSGPQPPVSRPPSAQPSVTQALPIQSNQPEASHEGISVASLFDADALPEWLRGPASMAAPGQVPAAMMPPQVEIDNDQVRAASVFAAVAGPTPVASPAEPWSNAPSSPQSLQPGMPFGPQPPQSGPPFGPQPAPPGMASTSGQRPNSGPPYRPNTPMGQPGQAPRPYAPGNTPFSSAAQPYPGAYPGNAAMQPGSNAPYAIGGAPGQRGFPPGAPGNRPGNLQADAARAQVPAVVRKRGFWSWVRSLFRFGR